MNDIYTSPEKARDLLQERMNSSQLRNRVRDYLGGLIPNECLEGRRPVAVLPRYVARGTDEDRQFACTALSVGFRPFWATYKRDKYTTRNPEKVETIRPPVAWAKGQKTRTWVVVPENREGGIGELPTVFGARSDEYQASLRDIVFRREGLPELTGNQFDVSDWYDLQAKRFGYQGGPDKATFYYPAYVALASAFCVMYEDFDDEHYADDDLARFRNNVLYPAIDKVKEELGIGPLIVRLQFRPGMNETNLRFLDPDETEQMKKYGTITGEAI